MDTLGRIKIQLWVVLLRAYSLVSHSEYGNSDVLQCAENISHDHKTY